MIEIRSETTATVWQVHVSVGQRVARDDVLVVLESMKIEIPVTAPVAGVVVDVRVEPDARVVDGDVVVVLDPAP